MKNKNNFELTPREIEVKALMLQGYTNKEIANTLFVSTCTVSAYVHHIFDKLCLKNRYQMFVYEIERLKSIIQSCEKGVSNVNK